MNQSFLNPFVTPSVPESVHQIIAPGTQTACLCARFNPRGLFAGQYIASGRADAGVAIYDLETRGMIRYLEGHVKAVTSVAWSYTGRFLVSASADWNVVIWDLKPYPAARLRTVRFDAPVTQVSFAPGSSKLLLVTLESQQALLVDLRRKRRKRDPRDLQRSDTSNGHSNGSSDRRTPEHSLRADWQTFETRIALADEAAVKPQNSATERADPHHTSVASPPISTAIFSPRGSYIFAGTTRGDILAFSVLEGCRLVSRASVSGSSAIREITIDRSGKHIVVNSNDRCIRIVAIEFHSEDKSRMEPVGAQDHSFGANAVVQMHVLHKFQDLVSRTPWNGVGFSGDGEFVFAGAAHKAAHNVYVWDRGAGALDKILEGPREPLVDADWHPIRPLLLSVSVSGSINIWFTPNAENWSAYAPGFVELEENDEYQEGEDEFDLEDEDEVTRRKQDEEEVDVDVTSMGPLPGNTGATPMAQVIDPGSLKLDAMPQPSGTTSSQFQADDVDGEAEWEYRWDADPETRGETFSISLPLEEEDLDEGETSDRRA